MESKKLAEEVAANSIADVNLDAEQMDAFEEYASDYNERVSTFFDKKDF